MTFELFDPKARQKAPPRPAGSPAVTVSDNKLLLVNRTATEALGEPRRLLLYFDREDPRAGIRGTEEEGPPSYSVTPRSNGNSPYTAGPTARSGAGRPSRTPPAGR